MPRVKPGSVGTSTAGRGVYNAGSLSGGPPLQEQELVERARIGDVNAYEQLVERYTPLAFRTAYLITRSEADAQDACQEAFIKAYRALRRFRPEASLRPWLLKIVANEARNQRRGFNRRTNLSLRVAERLGSGDAAPSPEALAETTEEREQLLRAVNALREEDRLVVNCRYFLDLSSEETADVLHWPEGTVKSRLSRALARLRQRLGASDG